MSRPAGRAEPQGVRCPFCGALSTLLSWNDSGDVRRIRFYCDNPGCAVREWQATALTTGPYEDGGNIRYES